MLGKAGLNRPARTLIRAFLADRVASPATEFAVICPVLITLLMAGYDASAAMICWHQTYNTAQTIAHIVTELGVQTNQTNSLTVNQLYQAETAIYPSNPRLYGGNVSFSVVASAVVFTASPANCIPGINCVYTANTAWSVPLSRGQQVRRPCGKLTQVSSVIPGSLTTLPTAGITALTSLVVVDVTQTYTPLFSAFTGPLTVSSTAMLMPRAGSASQYVQYDLAGVQAGTSPNVCAGYL